MIAKIIAKTGVTVISKNKVTKKQASG